MSAPGLRRLVGSRWDKWLRVLRRQGTWTWLRVSCQPSRREMLGRYKFDTYQIISRSFMKPTRWADNKESAKRTVSHQAPI